MTPTEEQIFDYFLGKTSPEISRAISAYLKSHPDKERELKEWADVEEAFREFPLKTPNELILNRVRNAAREQASAKASEGVWAQIKAVFTPRVLGLSFMLVLAVALSVMLRVDQGTNSITTVADNANQNDSQMLTALRSDQKGAVTNVTESGTSEKVRQALLAEYDQAVTLYQSGQFEQASEKFSAIMTQNSGFEKRKELYTYWIESLKKLGKYDLAEKKQQLLEQILTEETGKNGQ